MEKKYSVKLIDVLYYDDKVLPVSYSAKNGRKQLVFLSNDAKLDVLVEAPATTTVNKGAQRIMTLLTANGTKRYAEFGTLTAAIINYGLDDATKFQNLAKVRMLVDEKNLVDSSAQSKIAREYFSTELTTSEIKALFVELQKNYEKNRHSCQGRA